MGNTIIYDLEIQKAIPGRDGYKAPGVEYCGGWEGHANMGISVLCAYDYEDGLPLVYCADNLKDFQSVVNSARWLVGFNNARFDNRVLACNGISIPEEKTFDLLREIWRAAGLDPDVFNPRTHGGYGLDAVCAINFEGRKTGNGALAPVEWQRGQIGKVISYCFSDIKLTTRLWRRMVLSQQIINPKTGRDLAIPMPQVEWFKAKREV